MSINVIEIYFCVKVVKNNYMSDKIFLNTFPCNSAQALAMVYLKTLDLKGKTPEEIARMYHDAYRKIDDEQDKINEEESANYRVDTFLN